MKKTKITFEEFCKKYGIDSTLPIVSGVTDLVKKQMIATYIWELIVKTLNSEGLEKDWIPDFTDGTDKWELWLRYTSASGWSLYGIDDWYSSTNCGARRVFRTRDIAKVAAEDYLHFYIDTF